jgi:hypothetical protein
MDWSIFLLTLFISIAITAAIQSIRAILRIAREALRPAARWITSHIITSVSRHD